jgi:hypothetical protein
MEAHETKSRSAIKGLAGLMICVFSLVGGAAQAQNAAIDSTIKIGSLDDVPPTQVPLGIATDCAAPNSCSLAMMGNTISVTSQSVTSQGEPVRKIRCVKGSNSTFSTYLQHRFLGDSIVGLLASAAVSVDLRTALAKPHNAYAHLRLSCMHRGGGYTIVNEKHNATIILYREATYPYYETNCVDSILGNVLVSKVNADGYPVGNKWCEFTATAEGALENGIRGFTQSEYGPQGSYKYASAGKSNITGGRFRVAFVHLRDASGGIATDSSGNKIIVPFGIWQGRATIHLVM